MAVTPRDPDLSAMLAALSDRIARLERPATITAVPSAWQAITYGTNINSFNVIAGGSTWFEPGCRTENGSVRLKGLIIATAAISAGSTVFTLPVGFRPPSRALVNVMANADVAARLDIQANGQAVLGPALGNGSYVSLDGVTVPLA